MVNETKGTVLATDARYALKRAERRRGLLGRDSMEQGEAVVFPRCRQVHMFGMRFAIDVLFLDRDGFTVHLERGLEPGHLSPWIRRARTVIELPAGTVARTSTEESDLIRIR